MIYLFKKDPIFLICEGESKIEKKSDREEWERGEQSREETKRCGEGVMEGKRRARWREEVGQRLKE